MKVFIKTYGCSLNQADSELMEGVLIREGHEIVEREEEADAIVVNTCTVKGATENKIMNYLEKLSAKGKKVVAAGCLTTHKKQLSHYASSLISPGAVGRVGESLEGKKVIVDFGDKGRLPRRQTGAIARIAIQEGCMSSCTFCETKIARPRLMSQSIESILLWIRQAVNAGAVEIQLAGMDTGTYGTDRGYDVADLLTKINKMEGMFRARLGMNNPQHIKRLGKKLITAYEGEKIYKFLHTAVQSGSEKVVADMERTHSVEDFEEVVKSYREEMPSMTIATDIIVGYPTEEESDFEESIALVKRTMPDVVNVSKFTPRPLTRAAKLKQLPSSVVKERSRIMSEVVVETTKNRNKHYIGREMEAIVTEEGKGRTENYKQVVFKENVRVGQCYDVKVVDANHTSLFVELLEKSRE